MKPIILAALLLALMASACIEDGGAPSTGTATPGGPISTVPAGSPGVTPTCAASSTQRFLEVQSAASFKVYCPTFLPAGFALEDVRFEETLQSGTPIPGPGAVIATFRRDTPAASLRFVQGRPSLSEITDVRTSSEGEPTDTAYDGFEGSLFDKGVLARSPDGFTHIISAAGLTVDDLQQIAAGMQAVVP
jgi:hypothetical protein